MVPTVLVNRFGGVSMAAPPDEDGIQSLLHSHIALESYLKYSLSERLYFPDDDATLYVPPALSRQRHTHLRRQSRFSAGTSYR